MNGVALIKLRHAAAVASGLAVFALIFTCTGDADLWTAVTSGIGAALLFYFAIHLRDRDLPDGGA